jgi:AcrR family transcriptional regulator
MTPPPSSRRRAPALTPEQRRETIVRAALPLVAERGSAVTTAEVARAAGIAEGTIFRVFDDKNALLDACVAEALRPDQVLAELATIDLDQPLAKRLVDAAEALSAHLGRIGAVIGNLHATGRPMERRAPALGDPGGGAEGAVAALADRGSRARSQDATIAAVAELFEPERDQLRIPPETAATIVTTLLFTRGRSVASDVSTETVVDVFLNGVLAAA